MYYRLRLSQLYRELGFKGGKIPPDYERQFEYDVPLDTYPRNEARLKLTVMILKAVKGPRKSSAHRVFVKCPKCGKTVPAGRLDQHVGAATCQ